MTTTTPNTLTNFLGSPPSSDNLSTHLWSLASASNASASPEIKSYPDSVYFNYFQLGLSLLFSPVNGYKPRTGMDRAGLRENDLALDSIYIYNHSTASNSIKKSERQFAAYPVSPLSLILPSPPTGDADMESKTRPLTFAVLPETTGKDFVAGFGEPDRKGGGAGPSSGSIGIWCEWSKYGVMVEFGGDEARGPQAWEHGKDAVWKVITIFHPTS
jgi:hypothetical protein